MHNHRLLKGTSLIAFALTAIPAFAQAPDAPVPPAPESPTPPRAEEEEKGQARRKIPPLGVDFGVYLPVNSLSQTLFGDAWYSFGIGIGGVQRATKAGRFQFDSQFISNTRSRNRAYIIPVGINYQIALTDDSKQLLPYVTASVNFVGTYLSVPSANIKYGFRPSYGGSIAVGATYKKQGFVEARYHQFADVRGVNFSGLEIGTGIRF